MENLIKITNETVAANVLLTAYRYFGLEDLQGNKISICIVKFSQVEKKEERWCNWKIRETILDVSIKDINLEDGVLNTISAFAEQAAESDSKLKTPKIIIFTTILIILSLFFQTILYFVGYKSIAILVCILALLIIPIPIIRNYRFEQTKVEVYMQKLTEARFLAKNSIRDHSFGQPAIDVYLDKLIIASSLNEKNEDDRFSYNPHKNRIKIHIAIFLIIESIFLMFLIIFLYFYPTFTNYLK
jgi:hypothetical protein